MFDSFSRSFGSTPSHLVENDNSGGLEPVLDPFFGAIASYQICGCCGNFHAVTDGTNGGGQGVILNADDRGVFGPNGKPSLDPIDAGGQITRSNTSWATGLGQPAVVTFAFRDSFVTTLPEDTQGHNAFSAAQISATLLALAAWSDVANITFQRVTDGGTQYSENATILFGNYTSGQSGAAAFAYLPGGMPGATAAGAVQGDVWINSSLSYNALPLMQAYGQQVLLHEIGHAIGLSHPAAYNASANGVITYAANATYFEDSRQYTVMSYFTERETGADFRDGGGNNRYSAVPLLDDIAAAQRLYGANTTTRTGDTTYGFNSNAGQPWFTATNSLSALIFAVWDAGGADTFDFSGYTVAQTIDLRQGAFSSVGGLTGNVAIAIGAVIENVVGGSGADTIRGNSAANLITSNGGNDEIDGGLGSDTVVFAGARSSYTVTWNGQVGTVTGLGQTVTVSNVEFLQFSDTTIAAAPTGGLLVGGDITNETIGGTAFGDTIGGLGGNDTINGLAGTDTLDGGSGDDVLNGGDHDDVLIGGRGDDALNGGAGHDVADYADAAGGITVNLAVGLASGGAGSDTLTGIEEVRGTAHNDTITGDANANIIHGGGGIDTLNGGGGADQMFAGAPGEGGGAPDIVKAQGTANNSIASAVALAGSFDLGTRADVANSTTIPHATVVATSHGGMEYYAVTVAAGETVVFDIDNASFDSVLRIYTAADALVVQNDDNAADGGPATDSGLSHTFAAAGTYYIQVSQWQSGADGTLVTSPPPAGGSYTLHVSVPSAPVVPLQYLGATMNGEAGADALNGGVGRDTLNGGADDDVLNGGLENDSIDGGTGSDTAVFTGNRAAYTISTSSGVTTVTGPDGTDSLTNVERLQFADGLFDITGAPVATTINGTSNGDALNGTTGGDTINGLDGDDVITGGLGNDTIDGGAGVDTAVFSGTIAGSAVTTSSGTTTVSGPDGTDTLTNIEYLRFSDGTLIVGANGGQRFEGTAGADVITGTAFSDQIVGRDGNDIIDGSGGADQMAGGTGDDRYNVDHGNDEVNEGAGEGYDRVLASTSYTLQGATEIEWLSTSFTAGVETISLGGNALNNLIEGNNGQNLLEGHAGNDTLVGHGGNDYLDGGLGADQMSGGLGDDFYRVDNINDFADEGAGEGYDRILASTSYTLLGASEIEWLSTSFTAGVETISLGGNALNNLIEGNNGQNLLEGHAGNDTLVGHGGNDYLDGGLGADQMSGGLGDDFYRVDNINDFADEGAGEGYDRILASTSYTLLGASEIEWLSTSFTAGVETISLGGNALNNLIEGNNGQNLLEGHAGNDTLVGHGGNDYLDGGLGADQMSGGLGDDFYRVDNINDFADEGAGEGYDRVLASTSYTLLGASEIEWLSTSFTAGVETISLGGNALNNLIEGNNGQNLLEGHAGNDTLVGHGGNDYLDGGLGADQMSGGLGDDFYRVDNINDFADEGAGEGYDRVLASTSYTLLGASEIEWLSTSFTAGVDAINLTGNALDNLIEGNNGANRLDGGAGDDELLGYAGDDILIGGGGNDRIDGGDGFDTLQLTGLAADYTIVAQNGGYRVTDNVPGRDGVILMTTVESIRFGDGSTLPMAAPVTAEKPAAGDALVLPAVDEDGKATEEGPQVLPTIADGAPQILPGLAEAKGAQDGDLESPGGGDVPLVIPGADDFVFKHYDEIPLVLPDESDSFQGNPGAELFEQAVFELPAMDGAHSLHLLPSEDHADPTRPNDPWA